LLFLTWICFKIEIQPDVPKRENIKRGKQKKTLGFAFLRFHESIEQCSRMSKGVVFL
jgi:hypothetical protein